MSLIHSVGILILIGVFLFSPNACGSSKVKKSQVIVNEAMKYIGVEEKGINQGETVERIQKYVDGRANKEPWCMSFVQYLLGTIGEHKVYKSEHVYTVWLKTSIYMRRADPKPGYIAVWRRVKNGQLTTAGHTGIVLDVKDDGTFRTIEANVRSGGKEGVFIKNRKIGIQGSIKLIGFIKSW